jgi:manganese/zinc/iron transport system permease protein
MSAVFSSIPAMIVLTGLLVGASAALLGSFLVLRGTAMLTDAISHSIVLGIVLVWLVTKQTSGPVMVLGAAAMGVATVFLTEALARSRLLRMDAAIGLVFPALFATGVLLIALNARNLHLDVDSVLLGEIGFVWLNTMPVAGVQVPVSVVTLAVVLVVNLAVVLALWKELKLASFDPGLAAALGLMPGLLHYLVLTLTSITAVAAFEAVGAILFVAFVIAPPASAWLLTRRLGAMVALSVALSALACGAGYGLAVFWDVSIGGMMALMTGVIFALALLFAPERGILSQVLSQRMRGLDHDCQVLIAHLQTHKDRPEMAGESRLSALIDHLRWPEDRARAVILRALDRGLIERRDELLVLSQKGEGAVHALMERHRAPARQAPGRAGG